MFLLVCPTLQLTSLILSINIEVIVSFDCYDKCISNNEHTEGKTTVCKDINDK